MSKPIEISPDDMNDLGKRSLRGMRLLELRMPRWAHFLARGLVGIGVLPDRVVEILMGLGADEYQAIDYANYLASLGQAERGEKEATDNFIRNHSEVS